MSHYSIKGQFTQYSLTVLIDLPAVQLLVFSEGEKLITTRFMSLFTCEDAALQVLMPNVCMSVTQIEKKILLSLYRTSSPRFLKSILRSACF